jgi:hypothetical protein
MDFALSNRFQVHKRVVGSAAERKIRITQDVNGIIITVINVLISN